MKRILIFCMALLLLSLTWPPRVVLAQGWECARFIGAGSYTLEAGETLEGNLCLIGGVATLQEGSVVHGDARVMAGTLSVQGTITGDILATGGAISLGGLARVEGNINLAAASLNRAPGAEVLGDINRSWSSPSMSVPGLSTDTGANFFSPIWTGLMILFQSFVWAVVALLVLLFFPTHAERAAQTIVSQPLIALGMGLLTIVVMPILLVIMSITIIGLPVALVGAIALVAAWAFGMVVLGLEVGKRLGSVIKVDLAPAVQAGLGVFLLTLTTGLVGKIPCIGPVTGVLVSMIGLGAVLLTFFGTRPYPLPAALQSAP